MITRSFSSIAHTGGNQGPHLSHRGNRLTPGLHPFAERSGHHCEHDIIDRAAMCLTDRLEVCQTGIGHPIPARLTNRTVKRVVRRWSGHRKSCRRKSSRASSEPLSGLSNIVSTSANSIECSCWTADHLSERLGDQVGVTWLRSRIPRFCLHGPRLGGQIKNHLTDIECPGTINHGVMGLGQDRESALGQALHEVHLPERTVAVQWTRHDSRDEFLELIVRPRPGEGRSAHMEVHIKILIVDPHRICDATGNPFDLLSIAGHETDSGLDEPGQAIQIKAGLRCLKQHHTTDVHRRCWLLQIQEGHVQ